MCKGCRAKERLVEAQQVVAEVVEDATTAQELASAMQMLTDILAARLALEAGEPEDALRMTSWLIDPQMVEGAVA